MASSRNSRTFSLAAGIGLAGAFAFGADAVKPAEDAENAATATQPVAPPKKETERLDIPVPKGQPQKGLRIPIHSPDGKLMMNFQIGVAEVVDADNIKMGDLRLETFKESGEHEFDIDLPDSVFNAKTKEVTSKTKVRVKRQDFEITSNSVTFNVETRSGKFGDGVKMIIFDARAADDDKEEKTVVPTIEIQPPEDPKKK